MAKNPIYRRAIAQLAIFLILVATSTSGQDTQIISFKYGDELVWTNSMTNTYCGVEWSSNLRYTWQALSAEPPYWDILATQSVMSVAQFGSLTNLWEQVQVLGQAVGDPAAGMFFRIASSTNRLGPRFATNTFRVVNSSSSVLSNVVLSAGQSGGGVIDTVLPGTTSQWVDVSIQWPAPASQTNIAPMVIPSADWSLSFTQDGAVRSVSDNIFPFGPAQKNIFLVVSNAATYWKPGWLTFERELKY